MIKKSWEGPFHASNPYRRNEKEIMDKLKEIKTLFNEQGYTHPDQENQLVDGIHKIQDIIMYRICQRDYPKEFPTYQKQEGEWVGIK